MHKINENIGDYHFNIEFIEYLLNMADGGALCESEIQNTHRNICRNPTSTFMFITVRKRNVTSRIKSICQKGSQVVCETLYSLHLSVCILAAVSFYCHSKPLPLS